MKHVLIGTLLGLIVLLLGGCTSTKGKDWQYNSPFEDLTALFTPTKWKGPITGERQRWATAEFHARTSGDVSQLNRIAYEQGRNQFCAPQGWSSTGPGDVLLPRYAFGQESGVRFYKYYGRILVVPPRGTTAYDDYLWRTKK